MANSPTGDLRHTLDASMSTENRDSCSTGKKNDNSYEKDILGDLGASSLASVESPSSVSQVPEVDEGVDLISVVPSSPNGMNEYLMQHMRTLLNPLLVGGESNRRQLPAGPASSGGSSSDDENDVLVWRLPPSAVEVEFLHEAAPNSHDVSGDFIDIDMVTPSNRSMDGTSSMDDQNNLDVEEESDVDGEEEEEELLEPLMRRVEGQVERDEGSFNNLSLNLMVESESEPREGPRSSSSSSSSSRMNVASSPDPVCDCHLVLWPDIGAVTVGNEEKVMLWTPQEVEEKRYFGLGDSARSGPTAISNVLSVLKQCVSTRAILAAAPCATSPAVMVEKGVPLTSFLLDSCAAGCPASSLVDAVHQLTGGAVRGFFLPLRAAVSPCGGNPLLCGQWECLWRWLAVLVRAGVVPMVTLNCQQQGVAPIDWIVPPDWHHQMVYGVDAGGLYLTGPEEFLQGDMVMRQLVSDNVLLVRKSHVLTLWKEDVDLWPLARQSDPKWENMNVLGQVVGTLRQSVHKNFRGFHPEWAHHVSMPTPTHAGLTLFVRVEPPTEGANSICQRLSHLTEQLHTRLASL